MAVTFKHMKMNVKDGNVYKSIDTVSDGTTAERVAAVETAGTEQIAAVAAAAQTQIGLVGNAGTEQIAAVAAAAQTQIGLVGDAGTTQIGLVGQAGTNQIAAVQAKGVETIASIPSDYTDLSNDVNSIKSASNNKINAVYSGKYQFISGYIRNGLSVGQTCDYKTITTDSSWQCLVIEAVPVGTKFHIKTDGANSARGYSWLDSSGVVIAVSGKTETQTMQAIQCPNGASILVINERLGVAITPEFYRDDSIDALKEQIEEIDLSLYVEKEGVGQVTIENCDFTTTETSVNKCDPNDVLWDKGIDSSGNIVDAEGYVLTGEVAVTGHYAWFGVSGTWHYANRLGLYKKDNTFERVSNAQGYDVSNCNKIVAFLPYTSNQDTFYVGFSESSEIPPLYDNYFSHVIIDPAHLPEAESINKFNGLKAVAFGTSLTARANEDHKYEYSTYGYLTYLRQYSGMTIDNQGVGGATILSNQSNKSIYVAITSYSSYADKDVCIIEGFVNDWDKDAENTLGQFTDNSQNTVCGRLRNAITYVLTQNPNMTVIVILDHYGRNNDGEEFSSTTVKNGYTPFQYYEELYKVCESMGIKCIKEYALSEIGELTPQYLADYIHMNDLGAKQSATTIWDQMKLYSPNHKSN